MHCRSLHAAAAALLLAAALMPAPGAAQSQLPRPSQLPPAGGGPAPRGAPQQQAQPPQQPQQQQQQQQTAPVRPYTAVAISEPPPVNDPSFEAFRKQLGEVARRKDRAALARLVVAKDFFWEGERGNKADKRKSGADNLAAVLALNVKDSSGWEALEGFAADPTGMLSPAHRNVTCAPAEPVFDAKALEDVAKATGIDDWGYPMQPGLEVRESAQPTAPVIEKLGMHFVRVMLEDGPPGPGIPALRIVTPSGKVGFVPMDAISPLGGDQICYSKDASGAWKIAGFIGD